MSTQFVIPFVNATFKEKLIYLYVDGVMWIFPGSPWLSILEATTAVSPRTIYLGIFVPNTPPTTEPVCTPILIWKHISISNYANLQASIWLGKLFFFMKCCFEFVETGLFSLPEHLRFYWTHTFYLHPWYFLYLFNPNIHKQNRHVWYWWNVTSADSQLDIKASYLRLT